MRIPNAVVIITVAIGLWIVPLTQGQTTTVRGQLLRNGQVPAAGIQVTLYSPAFGRSSPSVSGYDGIYSIYNVPLGNYYLEIWISNPPQGYQVQVTRVPFNDLPRLPVP